jgi:hypothetical protein
MQNGESDESIATKYRDLLAAGKKSLPSVTILRMRQGENRGKGWSI